MLPLIGDTCLIYVICKLYVYNSAFFDIKVRNVEVSCVSGPSLLVKGVFLCVLKLVVCLVCQLKPHTQLGASWGHI